MIEGAPTNKFKTSRMEKEENFPVFFVETHYPNGTNVMEQKRPKLPLYVRIALIGLYDENCDLQRKIRQLQEVCK